MYVCILFSNCLSSFTISYTSIEISKCDHKVSSPRNSFSVLLDHYLICVPVFICLSSFSFYLSLFLSPFSLSLSLFLFVCPMTSRFACFILVHQNRREVLADVLQLTLTYMFTLLSITLSVSALFANLDVNCIFL